MVPVSNQLSGIEYVKQPSKTFAMRVERETVKGNCDGIDAVKQAVFLILNVERYQCPLVSWDYGVELADLIGMPTSYCIPELEQRITEALMQDDRITKVYNFTFDVPRKGVIYTTFLVESTEGMIKIEKEVTV